MTTLGRATIALALWPGIMGGGVGAAAAAELKVFSAGAVRASVTELAQAFQQETDHTVTFSFSTVGITRQKLASGEPLDVVIMTDVALDDVAKQGAVVPGSRADLARTGMWGSACVRACRSPTSPRRRRSSRRCSPRSRWSTWIRRRAPPAVSTSRASSTGSASRTR